MALNPHPTSTLRNRDMKSNGHCRQGALYHPSTSTSALTYSTLYTCFGIDPSTLLPSHKRLAWSLKRLAVIASKCLLVSSLALPFPVSPRWFKRAGPEGFSLDLSISSVAHHVVSRVLRQFPLQLPFPTTEPSPYAPSSSAVPA